MSNTYSPHVNPLLKRQRNYFRVTTAAETRDTMVVFFFFLPQLQAVFPAYGAGLLVYLRRCILLLGIFSESSPHAPHTVIKTSL